MQAPPPGPETLVLSSLSESICGEFECRTAYEMILARQATWASAHLPLLMRNSPSRSDAFLRLYSRCDRILHRNVRQ